MDLTTVITIAGMTGTLSDILTALFSRSLNYRGSFAQETAYGVGDCIINAGSLYRCETAFTSGTVFDAKDWTVIALSGADGVTPQLATGNVNTVDPGTPFSVSFRQDTNNKNRYYIDTNVPSLKTQPLAPEAASGQVTVSMAVNQAFFAITMSAASPVVFANLTSGTFSSVTLQVKQPAKAPGFAPAFQSKVIWAGGVQPAINTTPGKVDTFLFWTDGTDIYGSLLQAAGSPAAKA